MHPAQRERLAMLAEEAGEIVQMVGKCLRHGMDSHHPDDPAKTPNSELLSREINDLRAVVQAMHKSDRIAVESDYALGERWKRKLRYTHHQETTHESR